MRDTSHPDAQSRIEIFRACHLYREHVASLHLTLLLRSENRLFILSRSFQKANRAMHYVGMSKL